MYILSINMWFQKLMKQFFFGIDSVVYNAISYIYDLLISIARTSILSQADILDMADRIYKLLAIFMIFKVTLSLITYVVNPDDFLDKSKGVSKLSLNIIISLGLLILTPYIFNMAYRLQTIILEDNTLASLIFGDENESTAGNFFNSAGDKMAYITMSAFFTPNLSIDQLHNCIDLTIQSPNGNKKFNPECSGLDENGDVDSSKNNSLGALTVGNPNFSDGYLQNYVTGVENQNLGLMFRQELAIATDSTNTQFIMDYKYIFSTVIGVIIALLLINFCMDIALRSIKLSFLQLIAPIPILSYVDPKSGKDGMFKKWYQLCFKTYLSLFIRLLAIYFAVYIISKVADLELVDIVDGSKVSHPLIAIFIIIGALMFAKQLPKILEGLGIKLDGDGKFTLNPFKKFENEALGGKKILGAGRGLAAGAMMGATGMASGAGIGRGISGVFGGLKSGLQGKKFGEIAKDQSAKNMKMRQARLDGSTFGGRMGARFAGAMGLPNASENIEGRIHGIDEQIKKADNSMAPTKKLAEEKKLYTDSVSSMEKRAIEKIENGEAGVLSKTYRQKQAHIESLKAQLDQQARAGQDTTSIEEKIANAENDSRNYLNDIAMKQYIDVNNNGMSKDANGNVIDRNDVFGKPDGEDATLTTMTKKMESIVETYGDHHEYMKKGNAAELHSNLGKTKGEITDIEIKNEEIEKQKRDLNEEKQSLYEQQRITKANESAIK